MYCDSKISCLLNGAVKCFLFFGLYKILGMTCSNIAVVSLTFSAGGQLVFTGGQNYLNWTSLLEKLSARWSNRAGKDRPVTAGQFARCLALNETPALRRVLKVVIDHYTVVCSVTWPLNGSEAAEVTLFWCRPHHFCCVNQVVLMLTSWDLNEKSREVCIKAFIHRPGT